MRITNVFFISCAAISIAYLKLTPAARERVLAFKKLNPEVRSFQVTVQDSQEVSSASATMSSVGKSVKSAKSASKFGIDDLTNVKSPRRKTSAASPSASAPKASIRGKGKKRKTSEDLQGFPLIRQQFLDFVNEVGIIAPVGYPSLISCLYILPVYPAFLRII
ncbi:hypothetical protein HanPSC8_Chr11g0499371 [Helianthus annuus]|nr:hypothetical protein HanPSC8_Chr11g0499371 [Helianthus annuus]